MASLVWSIASAVVLVGVLHRVWAGIYNAFFHRLAKFPGPRAAGVTEWYKTWQEVFQGRSWTNVLLELHKQYGEIVRVGPNELHFSNPSAYFDIYNNANRWDKDGRLYHCFGEDHSSFGFLTYGEAKQRKDVLSPLFSRRAMTDLQSLVWKNINRLSEALKANDSASKSSDMLFGLRCFTLDTIMAYCFAQDVKATAAPDFRAPIVVAMNESLPGFVAFRNFEPIRRMVFGMPGWLTRLSTPAMAGLVDLQELLGAQVTDVTKSPASALEKTPHPIIYHRLLDPKANPTGVPSPTSLYEEAQALLFGGADSAGNTTMVGLYHVLSNPEMHRRLKAELVAAWRDPAQDIRFEDLEKLPYLTAVIKESLRMAPGVPSPYPRVVPSTGATISGAHIPGGTVVGMSGLFVHRAPSIFPEPGKFNPERWLGPDAAKLERWLVAFSKGPRACLGQNLAMCELYIAFATLFRRFDLELDGTKEEDLHWKECFLPAFPDRHLRAFCRAVRE